MTTSDELEALRKCQRLLQDEAYTNTKIYEHVSNELIRIAREEYQRIGKQ